MTRERGRRVTGVGVTRARVSEDGGVIRAEAPGKLFVVGEYAVVEPGGRAVVIAVDRHVTVTLQPAVAPGRRAGGGRGDGQDDGFRAGHGRDEVGGTITSAQYGGTPRRWRLTAWQGSGDHPHRFGLDDGVPRGGHDQDLRRAGADQDVPQHDGDEHVPKHDGDQDVPKHDGDEHVPGRDGADGAPERDGDRRAPRHRFEIDDGAPVDHVASAIEVMEALRADRGRPARGYDLSISSDLDSGGRKLGLGSSAAVTVATVRAIAELHRLPLGDREIFLAALVAALRVAATSGGDIAASTLGGWVDYAAPDTAAVRAVDDHDGVSAVLRAEWPSLRLRRLPPPRSVDLYVGWTGRPASTPDLVAGLSARARSAGDAYERFLAGSADCVADLVEAIGDDDASMVLDVIGRARRLLTELAASVATQIETPELTMLADAAEAVGAAGKSSGAGGGDCGIVLATAGADVAPMLRAWRAAGIEPVALAVAELDVAEPAGAEAAGITPTGADATGAEATGTAPTGTESTRGVRR